jgi:pimeloyl-ACP methyl ester carboxylesterase
MHEQQKNLVASDDGTEIGYWTSGEGPPLVLVHGGLGDHSRWDALRPHLESHLTVHAMDRRGRGASGDNSDYSLEREFEDVAAVVEAVADNSKVDVYGSSFGGLCGWGAVARTSNIGRLALYEGWPPVNPDVLATPDGFVERMESLLAEGQREAALVTAYRELVRLTDDEIQGIRAQPAWPARVAAVHTIVREEQAFAASSFDPDEAASITVPTLLLVGSEPSPWQHEVDTVAAELPDSRVSVLEGQGHVADLLAPEVVAEPLLEFLSA